MIHYYDSCGRYFGDCIRFNYDNQLKEITEDIERRKGIRVLVVGSGYVTDAFWFAIWGTISIDPDEKRLVVARSLKGKFERLLRRKLRLEFLPASIIDPPGYDVDFDIVWMKQTFHLVEPRVLIYEAVAKRLSPGEKVVISETNAWNLLIEIALFIKRGS
jgi:SAM-dependent methyltransferase